jgi:hypothetical protein
MSAFWDTAQYSLVEVGRRFRGVYCLRYQGCYSGSTLLRNVRLRLRDYTALYPRLSSSYAPPWEPEILQMTNRNEYGALEFELLIM